MTPGAVAERAAGIANVRADGSADGVDIKQALVAAREIEAWVQAQVAGLIGQLSQVESFPEATIAETAKCSLGQANKAKERSETLAATPDLAAALDDGAITAGHVDALTRASKQLDDGQRTELFVRVEALVDVAAAATIDQFSQRVRLEAKKLQKMSAEDRLERQQRNTRLSMWTDEEGCGICAADSTRSPESSCLHRSTTRSTRSAPSRLQSSVRQIRSRNRSSWRPIRSLS